MPSDVENSPKHTERAANDLQEPETTETGTQAPESHSVKGKAKERSVSPSNSKHEDHQEEEEEHEDEGGEDDSKSPSASTSTSPQPQSTPWQAVFSPQYNAYYFYNTATGETTWTNPLVPEASGSTNATAATQEATSGASTGTPEPEPTPQTNTASTAQSTYAALQEAAIAQGIDPALAHLDPTLLAPIPGSSRGPGNIPTFTAQFNARTGAFAPSSSRTPGHLSEHERAKRMSEFYFDVHAWENQLAEQGGSINGAEEAGQKRKRPTKKDLERFKEQKKAKKIAKTAWLRT